MRRKENFILIFLGLICLLVLGWLIFRPGTATDRIFPFRYDPVIVTELTGEAFQQLSGSQQRTELTVGDTLVKRARIIVDGQLTAKVGSESFVMLNEGFRGRFKRPENRRALEWDVSQGTIVYRRFTGGGNTPNAIITPHGRLDMSFAMRGRPNYPYVEAQVMLSESRTIISVPNGPTTWLEADGSFRIDSGSKLRLEHTSGERFTGSLPGPAVIRHPEQEAAFPRGLMLRGFNIIWDDVSGALNYVIRVFDEYGASPLLYHNTEDLGYRVHSLAEGSYQAQVAPVGPRGNTGRWSEPLAFLVNPRLFEAPDCSDVTETSFKHIRFDGQNYLAGCLPDASADEHIVILYVKTDIWWLQPRADRYQIAVDSDGYFEVTYGNADEFYIVVAEQGYQPKSEIRDRRDLPDAGLPGILSTYNFRK